MLAPLMPGFPALPPGKDLLEWIQEKIADGTVVVPGAAEREEQARQEKERREAEQAELLAVAQELELPNPAEQVANLGRHLLEVRRFAKATGRKYVGDEWFEARNAVCLHCPSDRMKLQGETMRCADCGCHLNRGKLGLKAKNIYEALACERGHHVIVDKQFSSK